MNAAACALGWPSVTQWSRSMQANPLPSAKPSPMPAVEADASAWVAHVVGSVELAAFPSTVSGILLALRRTHLRAWSMAAGIGLVLLRRCAATRQRVEQ